MPVRHRESCGCVNALGCRPLQPMGITLGGVETNLMSMGLTFNSARQKRSEQEILHYACCPKRHSLRGGEWSAVIVLRAPRRLGDLPAPDAGREADTLHRRVKMGEGFTAAECARPWPPVGRAAQTPVPARPRMARPQACAPRTPGSWRELRLLAAWRRTSIEDRQPCFEALLEELMPHVPVEGEPRYEGHCGAYPLQVV